MIVDNSAVVSILLREPVWEPVFEAVSAADPPPGIGAPTLTETGLVLAARLGLPGKTLLARFVQDSQLRVLPFTDEYWAVAVDAYVRFGKGRHSAALNFGDCLTYATSRVTDEPLLCVGDDFGKTDLTLVRW